MNAATSNPVQRWVWRAARAALLLAPMLWAAVLVGRYGVDVPFSDQWQGEYVLFAKMHAGTLGVADFFAQHNEHRIFFPRLIFYGLARLTHWNIRAELWTILALSAVVLFNIWRTLRATGWHGTGTGFWLLFAADVLIFSPLNRENQLWGFQIGFLLPLACMTACVWVCREESARVRFAGAMALGIACTFSVASGFLCWLLGLPLLIQAGGDETWRRHRRWWVAWAFTFAGSLALYFHGYVRPPNHPSVWAFLGDPLLALKYWLTFLGLPFAFGTVMDPFGVSQAAAVVLLLLLAAAVGYLWRWRSDTHLRHRCLPWLLVTVIAVANAALATVGRVGMGLWQALASRYVIFAVFLPIGLSFLAATIYRHLSSNAPGSSAAARAGMGCAALASALALLHLLGAFHVAPGWEEYSHSLLKSKALVEAINVIDEPGLLVHYVQDPPPRAEAVLLDELGYLNPPLLKSPLIAAITDLSADVTDEFGVLEKSGFGPDHSLHLVGWAALPPKHRPADAVLLTYDDAQGRPTIFGVAETGEARVDVVNARQDASLRGSGWQKVCKPGLPPGGASAVKAWSFDAEEGRAYRLWGQIDLPK